MTQRERFLKYLRSELRHLEPLLRQGGFIPMIDHFVPPDLSYDTYCYYVEQRRARLEHLWPG